MEGEPPRAPRAPRGRRPRAPRAPRAPPRAIGAGVSAEPSDDTRERADIYLSGARARRAVRFSVAQSSDDDDTSRARSFRETVISPLVTPTPRPRAPPPAMALGAAVGSALLSRAASLASRSAARAARRARALSSPARARPRGGAHSPLGRRRPSPLGRRRDPPRAPPLPRSPLPHLLLAPPRRPPPPCLPAAPRRASPPPLRAPPRAPPRRRLPRARDGRWDHLPLPSRRRRKGNDAVLAALKRKRRIATSSRTAARCGRGEPRPGQAPPRRAARARG